MTKHFKNIVANMSGKKASFVKSKENLALQLNYSKKHAAMHENEQSSIYRLREKKFLTQETKY
jgi:hypothetical protein